MNSRAFYFSDGPYLQLMQGLHAALSTPEAFIKLMGNSRTGKSSLCEKLTAYMRRKDYQVVYFNYAIESPEMLRTMLARELDLPDSHNFARLLEDSLGGDDDKPVILIFDDAHLLTDITLMEIYRLAEVQFDDRRMLNILLCGEPQLDQRLLSKKEFKSLLLNVSHNFLLGPMDTETLSNFLTAYLEKAGLLGLQLEPTALTYFYKTSKGYPGPALSICRLIAEARMGQADPAPMSKQELGALIKNSAEADTLPSSQLWDGNPWLVMGPVAAVLVIASIGLLYQQLNDRQVPGSDTSTLAASSNVEDSPFAEIEQAAQVREVIPQQTGIFSVEDDTDVNAQEETTPAGVGVLALAATAEAEPPLSDSSLALVTAAERGVAAADIAQPEYEDLDDAAEPLTTTAIDADASVANADIIQQQESSALSIEPAVASELSLSEPSLSEPSQFVPVQSPTIRSAPTLRLRDEEEPVTEPAEQPELELDPVEPLVTSERATIAASDPVEANSAPVEQVVEQVVEQTVASWVSAWENQELDSYFSSYHEEFEPRYQNSQAAWRENRRRVIGNAEWIRLELREFEVIEFTGDSIEVHFWIAYESPTYSDDTLKKLVLQQHEGSWLIVEEVNLEVRS